MAGYHSVKVKLSHLQLYKLKSSTKKNATGVAIRLLSDKIGTDKNNFPHTFLLTNRQVAGLCESFASSSFKDIKLSKTKLSKVMQSSKFLGRLPGALMKISLPLMKNIMTPLAKNVFVLL